MEVFQGCTPMTLLLHDFLFIHISKLSAEEHCALTAMRIQTAAFLFCICVFNFSSILRSTKRDRIDLCRLVGNRGIERESALVMGWRGTSP